MKKFLLSLIALFAAFSAFAVTETLTAASFGSPTKPTEKSYVSEQTEVAYTSFFITSSGNMQMNNKNNYCIYSKENPQNKVIKSITVNTASNNANEINVYVDSEPYTSSHTFSHGNLVGSLTSTESFAINPEEGNLYFHIFSAKGVIYVSSVEVEYADAADPRTFVSLSYPEKLYNAFLGEVFVSPVLVCDVEEARASVVYTSSDETVATVDANGNVTILDDGATTITASIPDDNENYYGGKASYDLIVKDPNALETTLDLSFFGNTSVTAYADGFKTVVDNLTQIAYTAQCINSSSSMGFNSGNKNGVGSGITVTSISPNYIISSINIEFNSVGSGVNVYKKDTAFPMHTSTTAISTEGATQVGTTVTTDGTIAIGAPAFAIVPAAAKSFSIRKITVTYAKKVADDGSVLFTCDAFKNYMINIDQTEEIVLPDNAPAITYTVADENIATIENGEIKALKPGNTKITASWEAVPGVWMAGSTTFTVYVKYANLAQVLADAQDGTTGFVKTGQTYVGNFPVTVGWSNEESKYNYVTDGTAWALFYVDHNHGRGAVLDAGWTGVLNEFEGLLEFSKITHTDITDYTGEVNIKSYDNLKVEDMTVNEVLILKNVTFKKSTPEDQYFIGYYNGQELNFYNMFGVASVEPGIYDVECAVNTTNGNLRLLPLEYTLVKQATYTVEDAAVVKTTENNGEKCNTLEYTGFVYCEGEDVENPGEFTLYMNDIALGTLDDEILYLPYAEGAVFTVRKEGVEPIAIENPWKDVLSATAKVVNPVYSVYTDKAEAGKGHVSASFNLEVEANFSEYVADFYFEGENGKALYELEFDFDNGIAGVNASAHLTWKNDKPFCEIHNLAVVDINNIDLSAINFGIKVVPTFPFLMTVVEQPAGAAMRAPRAAEPAVSYVSAAAATPITHEHMAEAKSEVSSVADVVVDGEAVVEFYNLQGVKVEGELAPGLYIRRQGNEATKVVVK